MAFRQTIHRNVLRYYGIGVIISVDCIQKRDTKVFLQNQDNKAF